MRLIDADKLIETIKNTADLGGWIPSELLQNLVYEIKKVEPLHYNPQTDVLEKCRTCLYKDAWDEWDGACEECEDYSEYEPQTERSE